MSASLIQSISDGMQLQYGVTMPRLGLGVWRAASGKETQQAVTWALETGYRHIDTATIYENEADVGKAIAASPVARENIFVTTKVWNTDQGYDSTLKAMDASLARLGMDYVDLYLVHWPKPALTRDTWRAMEEIYGCGKAKAIGVSNFLVHHLEDLLEFAEVKPMVNQVEFHPRLQQPELFAFNREHGIVHEAWSPIMKGRVNDVPELQQIAAAHDKTPVHVTLRWQLQKGIVTIPKSVKLARIQSNADLYDFELSEDDMAVIDGLDTGDRISAHPDEIDF
jgi:diketogulonate reductase-like aldo/keto reductase